MRATNSYTTETDYGKAGRAREGILSTRNAGKGMRRLPINFGTDRRCKHGIIDPDWCYDCFYEDDPEDDSL